MKRKKQLISLEKCPKDIQESVDTVEPRSAYPGHNQLLFKLKNGYQISVIKGVHSYSGPGTVEVAVMTKNGEFTYLKDNVEGYVTVDRFCEIVREVSKL